MCSSARTRFTRHVPVVSMRFTPSCQPSRKSLRGLGSTFGHWAAFPGCMEVRTEPRTTAERRAQPRFPVHLDLEYRLIKSGPLRVSGRGRSIDISSKGIAFSTETLLKPGTLIELLVNWPGGPRAGSPPRLALMGHVVRSRGRMAVCAISKFEFRPNELRMAISQR